MHIALSLPAEDASPWVDLFASALPEATIHLHEPGVPARDGVARAD